MQGFALDGSNGWRSHKTALGHLREHLENARMAEFVFVPATDEAKALTTHLLELTLAHETQTKPRERRRQGAALKSFERSIAAFGADLIHHSQFEAAAGFMYRPSDKDLMGQTLVSVRSFEQLFSFWRELGWMEATRSFECAESFEEGDGSRIVYLARARRFRALPALLELAAFHGITAHNVKEHFRSETSRLLPVTVRSETQRTKGQKKRGRLVKIKGPHLRRRQAEEAQRVFEINGYLSESGFDLGDPPRVCRLFNRGNWKTFDFNMGGRLICRSEVDWQRMPPAERKQITWRGEPTVELDVRASHMGILYALCEKVMPTDHDPYLLPPYDRDLVKGLFTIITGKGGKPERWTKELGDAYFAAHGRRPGSLYKVGDVVEALFKKHPVLGRIKYGALDWATLQFEESECFVECLLELGREHGVTGLPIHDSLIVAQRHQEIAERCLKEAYRRRFNYIPDVRVK